MDDIDAQEAYRQAIEVIERIIKWHRSWDREKEAVAIEQLKNRLLISFPVERLAKPMVGPREALK